MAGSSVQVSPGPSAEGEQTQTVRLEAFAQQLAAAHKDTLPGSRRGPSGMLIDYLDGYSELLRETVRAFSSVDDGELAISYAAEWILDNHYIVQQAIREVKKDLPLRFYRQLPSLAGGPLAGLPRTYALSREFLLFERAHLDMERVRRFIHAYQVITPLRMGELWSLPLMLRIAAIQALSAALIELVQRSGRDSPKQLPVIDLKESMATEEVVANSIISLRALANENWKDFFEDLSLVERVLSRDPANLYAGMDFDTRDRYRKVVEDLARDMRGDELEIARTAVRLAQKDIDVDGGRIGVYAPLSISAQSGDGKLLYWDGFEARRSSHVGYYLLDAGLAELEEAVQYRPRGWRRLRRAIFKRPTPVYLGGIAVVGLIVFLLLLYYSIASAASLPQLLLVALLSLVPAVTIAVSLVNWAITNTVPPRVLPKMDFSKGLPPECKTLVVIPSLLTDEEEVHSLLQQLEQHHLRNRDPHLLLALVSDFADAPQQNLDGDDALFQTAAEGIQALNERYKDATGGPFLLLHRERRWNEAEGIWMGWERKRGKLHELNRLLRGAKDTSYRYVAGNLEALENVRYVITLDADTILPLGSAHRLIGTLAHPLNRAVFGPSSIPGEEQVTAGFSILQPRTDINPSSANQSLFTQVFAGDTGLDLYTLAVSDVYQDFFGEGIFIGKGIYDVDAFERSLEQRVPENALLSHDLFEGNHGRVGLVSDIVLVEDYPPNYLVYASRLHRWIRGDWQLLPWLFREVPGPQGKLKNRFSAISRWKIIDNLRRSLISPALLLLLLAGWTVLPGSALAWTLLALFTLAAPLLTGVIGSWLEIFTGASPEGAMHPLRNPFQRWLLAVVFLPYEAWLSLSAIWVTLLRLSSQRRLLQWTTAAQSTRLMGDAPSALVTGRLMAPALVISVLTGALVLWLNPPARPPAAPLLVAWLLSPLIAYWISQPLRKSPPPLGEADTRKLRRLALKTWLFFEQFVGPEDHWLPPDHFQESPKGVVAHRTSPTNIGLALLAALSAFDFGYTGPLNLIARLRSTMENMEKLERYRGHILNWFDTRTLEPLEPRYVSTVDSGNLAACLLALRQGCLEMAAQPAFRWQNLEAWIDALDLLSSLLEEIRSAGEEEGLASLLELLDEFRQQVLLVKDTPRSWAPLMYSLQQEGMPEMERRLAAVAEGLALGLGAEHLRQIRLYSRFVRQHIDHRVRIVELLLPWSTMLYRRPELFDLPGFQADLQAEWEALTEALPPSPALGEIQAAATAAGAVLERILAHLDAFSPQDELVEAARKWCLELDERVRSAAMAAKALLIGFDDVARIAERMFQEMEFDFLFDPQRQVFHIGYNLTLGKPDSNYYDLMASEARIASLVAIAKGDVPTEHWLHLARPMTQLDGTRALLSWSATMFEYLMPNLFLRSYDGTLLHQSAHAVVAQQIQYGRGKNLPWGISESGYYRFDINQNYQYRAFGVPGLGYKRGLGDDLVVTPYASLLALPLQPRQVLENIDDLLKLRMVGAFGFYEAIDFTSRRLSLGRPYEIVKSYMAHHQGMILISLANYFHGFRMVERLHADPRIRSVELLLQEQIPAGAPLENPRDEEEPGSRPVQVQVITQPWSVPVETLQPRVHSLSNGRYSVLLTNTGGGYSAWGDIDLTRWRPELTPGLWGTWLYVQDQETGQFWSATHRPVCTNLEAQDVSFNAHMVEYRRRDGDISLMLEVTVPPDDDLEVRRVTLTNHGGRQRRLRLVSYGEVVLARQMDDQRHPAFNKLFIESEFVPEANALVFRRRPRKASEDPLFMAHAIVVEQGTHLFPEYETDRKKFLGRGQTVQTPAALTHLSRLTGSTGATLDPVFCLGQEFVLEPHATLQLAFLTLATDSRRGAINTIQRYQAWHMVDRAFGQARSQAEVELRRTGLDTPRLALVQDLLSIVLYPQATLRAPEGVLAANVKGQPGLWGHGISGDYPILLARIEESDELTLIHDLLQAHAYWRNRGLMIDLVILNDKGAGYAQELNNSLQRLLNRMHADAWLNRRGGIFIVSRENLAQADLTLLQTVARAILTGKETLAAQVEAINRLPSRLPPFTPSAEKVLPAETPPLPRPERLQFDNGYGGFSPDGREYVIYLEPGAWTPAPWTNVIANPVFGCLTTEAGLGYTWAVNSGENRLTPWSNDPVSDISGEAVYLRDEETAEIWSPTPQPKRSDAAYLVRHGAGYTVYEHHSHGLKQRLRVFVAMDEPVKVLQVRLENLWDRPRRITVTYYAEWVLGVSREANQQYIVPEYDHELEALLARNTYNHEFGERAAFAAASKPLHSLTTDRLEFIGRFGSLGRPAALRRIGLSGSVRAGEDPCAALQLHVDLPPGGVEEVYFLLGEGDDREHSLQLVRRFQDRAEVDRAWQEVQTFWDRTLGTVHVCTPDPAMDLMLNRWLLYQLLACRIWGRSAFYQSSGAYGFRDQLQDVMALVFSAPELAREHILRAAAHQFDAGDVLHWWHPPTGRGVRTRISDDLLWLPYVTAYYVAATGDTGILDEKVPFIKGKPLDPEEEDRYGQYESTVEGFPLFEHCRRALERGATAGRHNLPLIGGGDWNDGMNRVGIEGQGESVWLAWFLYDTLVKFAGLCDLRQETTRAEFYRQRAAELQQAIEANAWDGDWYLRAFFDDGTPLGSARNLECKIDSIAQSWAVISAAAEPQRSLAAMNSVKERLVRADDRLVLLFTPPFDRTPRDPGYIKGYLPGIRENGGQYTHAATWVGWAFSCLGQGDLAEWIFRLLNPVYQAETRPRADRYQVEPYVVAADVYSVPPHVGRGGWTWYTGSSGWLYRLGVEAILGLQLHDHHLVVDPCIPANWEGFEMDFRRGETVYHIRVENPQRLNRGVGQVTLDGKNLPGQRIPMAADGERHEINITLGENE